MCKIKIASTSENREKLCPVCKKELVQEHNGGDSSALQYIWNYCKIVNEKSRIVPNPLVPRGRADAQGPTECQ